MLIVKYCLYFVNGKDYIKEECLCFYDKVKYEIYKVLKEELFKVYSWDDLKEVFVDWDIDMKFKVSWIIWEMQGVKFEYNGFFFFGLKVN